jgi:prepilin-type N-terminal cleavage/methylation domain-containing protein
MSRCARFGMTLIEVLVVIAIIGLMIQLMLPALESSNEAARRTLCQNNLRQIGLGVTHHHDAIGHYPTGGWGWSWVGDPDRGRGKNQPGSWAFCVLDFIGEQSLSSIGKGKTGEAKARAIVELCATPIPIFFCPSRRLPRALPADPINPGLKTNDSYQLPIVLAARSDYAVNTGDFGGAQPPPTETFPRTYEEAESPDFKWFDNSKYTGISFGRSEIRMRDVTDGLSNTYMLGEKNIRESEYLTGVDKGDNETMYSGFDCDNGRSAAGSSLPDSDKQHATAFGSAHPDCWLAVFCDGSVHTMSFKIDKKMHKALANRADGQSSATTVP